jgi:putative ABC transport system permease protein
VYIFSAIALLILILGCVNFMNLATVQSIHRVHEVGVRKALGGHQMQLARQLLGETFLMCLLAFLAGLLLAELLLQTFNDFTGKTLTLALMANWSGVAAALGVVVIVAIVSGLYPALFLSKFETANILQGSLKLGSGSDLLRKTLVIAQFAVSIALAIGVGIIYQQMRFVQETQLGFEKEGVVFIKTRPSASVTFETLRNELLQDPRIKLVSASSNIPGRGASIFRFLPEGARSDEPVALPLMLMEHDFLQTVGITVKQGRDLDRQYPSDKDEAFLLNERAAKDLGWDQEALGKKMQLFAPGSNNIAMSGQVIGVIEDYHFESLHHEVKPLVLAYFSRNAYYAVKLDPSNLGGAISHLEKTWSSLVPEWPLELIFLDEDLGRQYRSDQQLEIVVRLFALLALSIACLGLFGLGSFMILRRTKEIGIRKVVGADSPSVWWMVSKDFTKLVLVANLIAAPVAYLTLAWWLQNFAYQVTVDWKMFLFCGITAILIAQLTTSYHTIKAAMLRPVDLIKQD